MEVAAFHGAPMHVARAACHTPCEVRETSQVGEARRAAVRIAQQLGFGEVAAGKVALVATELGNNLVRHAQGGSIWIAPIAPADDSGVAMVELLAVDRGPGIGNVAASLSDGFSTAGTPGTGLGAVRRLSTQFDMYSSVPQGTVIWARVAATGMPATTTPASSRPLVDVGAVSLPAPGETACGDAWAVAQDDARLALFVADGLGHGPAASEAAQAGVDTFAQTPFASPGALLERAHGVMRTTRGAAVGMAVAAPRAGTLTFCGAGNIAGRLVSGIEDRSLASQHGTVGVQIRKLQDVHYLWPDHALLVMHSDGLVTRWNFSEAPGLLQQHPAVIAGWLMREHRRGKDDATVVVCKRRSAG